MYIFLLFCVFYAILMAALHFYFEKKKSLLIVMERTLSITNFTNAVLATTLSTVVLANIDRSDMYGRKPNMLAGWTIESVCAYIVIEVTYLALSSYRLSNTQWIVVRDSLLLIETFHIVALIGLLSVLLLNSGYPLALWQIWTELTSIVIGLEECIAYFNVTSKLHRLVKTCSDLIFIAQRVLLCLYLVWLSWVQLHWTFFNVFQFSILATGTLINVLFLSEYV